MFLKLLILLIILSHISSYKLIKNNVKKFVLKATWQEELDQLLDIDTPRSSKRSLTKSIFGKLTSISSDVVDAVRERNLNKIAPQNLQYGKAIKGLRSFKNQLVSDIVPDIFTKVIPTVIDEGPKAINKIISDFGPSNVIEKGKKTISNVRELTQDPSMMQSTIDDLRREVKNIVKSTPVGLESPSYTVLDTREFYEIREYSSYSICTNTIVTSESLSESVLSMNIVPISTGFTELADYIFGKNVNLNGESEKMKMTTPVILDDKTMSFVLTSEFNADNAPTPLSDNIIIKDIPIDIIATREFSGLATENEINRQKAKLEDSLIQDSIIYDNLSFKVLTYNPPLTVPWLRRNEVAFSITLPSDFVPLKMTSVVSETPMNDVEIIETEIEIKNENIEPSDGTKFFSSPEAGD